MFIKNLRLIALGGFIAILVACGSGSSNGSSSENLNKNRMKISSQSNSGKSSVIWGNDLGYVMQDTNILSGSYSNYSFGSYGWNSLMTTDGSGNLYIVSSNLNAIAIYNESSGTWSQIKYPNKITNVYSIAVDSEGNIDIGATFADGSNGIEQHTTAYGGWGDLAFESTMTSGIYQLATTTFNENIILYASDGINVALGTSKVGSEQWHFKLLPQVPSGVGAYWDAIDVDNTGSLYLFSEADGIVYKYNAATGWASMGSPMPALNKLLAPDAYILTVNKATQIPYVDTPAGVFYYNYSNQTWNNTANSSILGSDPVDKFTFDEYGNLYALTNGKIFIYSLRDAMWESYANYATQPDGEINSISYEANDNLYALYRNGFLWKYNTRSSWSNVGPNFKTLDGSAINSMIKAGGYIAGTNMGHVYAYNSNTNRWDILPGYGPGQTIDGTPIHAVAKFLGTEIAGTDTGLWVFTGTTWVKSPLDKLEPVYTILVSLGRTFYTTKSGNIWYQDPDGSVYRIGATPGDPVLSIVSDQDGNVYIGTTNGVVFEQKNGSEDWIKLPPIDGSSILSMSFISYLGKQYITVGTASGRVTSCFGSSPSAYYWRDYVAPMGVPIYSLNTNSDYSHLYIGAGQNLWDYRTEVESMSLISSPWESSSPVRSILVVESN